MMREAATHVLVFMIADEKRQSKPYALPVRYLLTKGVTDARHRELVKELCNVMKQHGLQPIGKRYNLFKLSFCCLLLCVILSVVNTTVYRLTGIWYCKLLCHINYSFYSFLRVYYCSLFSMLLIYINNTKFVVQTCIEGTVMSKPPDFGIQIVYSFIYIFFLLYKPVYIHNFNFKYTICNLFT